MPIDKQTARELATDIDWQRIVTATRAACERAQKRYREECGCDDAYDAEVTIAGNGFCSGQVLRLLDHIERAFGDTKPAKEIVGWRVGKDLKPISGPALRIYCSEPGRSGYTTDPKSAHLFLSRERALREAADHWTDGRLFPVTKRAQEGS